MLRKFKYFCKCGHKIVYYKGKVMHSFENRVDEKCARCGCSNPTEDKGE